MQHRTQFCTTLCEENETVRALISLTRGALLASFQSQTSWFNGKTYSLI